ncbi:hypothetical protein [Segatella sp.]|uniref:hypothetical protein n=4 Tax=Segatella sp. TaxID=2974253 RepID=UPI003AAFE2DD
MEQKDIDIYEILKDMPSDTELYTPLSGKVGLSYMALNKEAGEAILVKNKNGEYSFNKNGRWMEGGEILLFPSNKMRDWSKLAWNTGDILVNKDGNAHVIFEGFDDDTYETFNGNNYLWKNEGITMCFGEYEDELPTSDFSKANKEDAQKYIRQIEKRLGYKLNFENLKIEKSEFKDGDVLFVKCNDFAFIEIFEYSKKNGDLCDHASLDITNQILDISGKYIIREDHITELRLATEEEKKQFFSALAKKGKAWDAKKKQVVDLKPVKLTFEIGKLYVFNEDDEDGELTIIGKLIDKNESEDTLTFGNQYEIENEKFVTDQAFDLRISVNKELREATENEVELFNKHYAIWKKEKEAKEHRAFKPFDKVLVRSGDNCKWLPALFIRDRGVGFESRHTALPIHSGEPASFAQCISYDGNEYLAFTSDPF